MAADPPQSPRSDRAGLLSRLCAERHRPPASRSRSRPPRPRRLVIVTPPRRRRARSSLPATTPARRLPSPTPNVTSSSTTPSTIDRRRPKGIRQTRTERSGHGGSRGISDPSVTRVMPSPDRNADEAGHSDASRSPRSEKNRSRYPSGSATTNCRLPLSHLSRRYQRSSSGTTSRAPARTARAWTASTSSTSI